MTTVLICNNVYPATSHCNVHKCWQKETLVWHLVTQCTQSEPMRIMMFTCKPNQQYLYQMVHLWIAPPPCSHPLYLCYSASIEGDYRRMQITNIPFYVYFTHLNILTNSELGTVLYRQNCLTFGFKTIQVFNYRYVCDDVNNSYVLITHVIQYTTTASWHKQIVPS